MRIYTGIAYIYIDIDIDAYEFMISISKLEQHEHVHAYVHRHHFLRGGNADAAERGSLRGSCAWCMVNAKRGRRSRSR
jgi:hypothetical protein